MTVRTKRILGWTGVGASYAALFLMTLVCAGVVFHRLAVERIGAYSRLWLRPWSSWHEVELVVNTQGIGFAVDGGRPPDAVHQRIWANKQ